MTPATRVAVFTDNDFEKVNGVTTVLTAALAGAPRDVHVRVYTASRLGCETDDYLALPSWGVGIPFYRDMLMYWPPYRTILRWLERDAINVVHLTTPGPMGLAALAAARRLHLPLIGSFHTDLARYTRVLSGSPGLEAVMRRYMRWLYGHCGRVLVPSQATRALVVRSGIPSARLDLWTRGVDAQVFAPGRRSPALRAEWRARDDRPVLLYVGRLSREKGVDQLAGTERQPDAAGRRSSAGDRRRRADARRDCCRLSRRGLPRHARRRAPRPGLRVGRRVRLPQPTDTAGNVVLEAQASGLPVLVSEDGGPREHMRPGVTGIVCPPEAQGWTIAAATLLTDEGTRQRMGVAAREFAASCSWDRTLAPLYDAYRQAAGVTMPDAGRAESSVGPRRVA